MSIGAVVVHYRSWPSAAAAVDALLGGRRQPDHVLVVDNASGDGSPAAIEAAFPQVEVVEVATNRGPAAAMNLGVERFLQEGMDSVLLLTDDCVLASPALERLEARLMAAPAVGAVGPLLALRSRPDHVFSAGGFIDRRTWDPAHHREPPRVGQWAGAAPQSCEWLDGACVLIRSQARRSVGPLDEHYFHYFDDVDHSLRLRSDGWEVECVPDAVAWQEPAPVPPELWVRNRLRFLARHAPRRILARELARQAKVAAGEVGRGDADNAVARLRGVARFAGRRWGA